MKRRSFIQHVVATAVTASVVALAGFIAVCFLAAMIGAFFRPGEWYEHLKKPSWRPPNRLFAPVWTILYVMIAVSGWLVWRERGFADAVWPFAIYAVSGAMFPRDDGDDYLSLCLRAKPDHSTEVRRVFAGSPSGPAFSVIDAIGGGANWPQLRAALKVESGREILVALLSPSAAQAEA